MNLNEQITEALKCGQDFRYWLNGYAWIEDKRRGGEIRFKLWKSQIAILPLFITAVYIFILKARQLGLTWLAAAYCLWLAMFRQNQLIVVVSRKEQYAVEFLDRVKFMFDRLPVWMKPHVLKRTQEILHFGLEEKDRKGNVVIKGLNSIIHSLTTTPEGAQSMTINLLVLDEASLIENIRSIWRSSKPGVDSAGGRAIVISNPIKEGPGWPWFREWYIKALRKQAGRIRALFMPWFDHPDRGPDFIAIQKTEGYDDDDIARHYPSTVEEAIEALTGSYFGRALTRHKEFKTGEKGYLDYDTDKNIEFIPKRHGILEVWEVPDGKFWRDKYCIFSDVSEGLGQTDSVAYVFDRTKRRFIAKLISSKIDADQWGNELIKLAKWCGDNPMLCPERSGPGQTTVKQLRKEKYPRIYRDRKEGRIKGKLTPNYGWAESRESKKLLSAALKAYLRDTEENVPDGMLIDQCSTYILHSDGRLGKEDESKKDDCVITAGGCLIIDETLSAPYEDKKAKAANTGKDVSIEFKRKGWREQAGIETGGRNPWVE